MQTTPPLLLETRPHIQTPPRREQRIAPTQSRGSVPAQHDRPPEVGKHPVPKSALFPGSSTHGTRGSRPALAVSSVRAESCSCHRGCRRLSRNPLATRASFPSVCPADGERAELHASPTPISSRNAAPLPHRVNHALFSLKVPRFSSSVMWGSLSSEEG